MVGVRAAGAESDELRAVRRPASTTRFETFTPETSELVRTALPFVGTSVGKPTPVTTVSGRVTFSAASSWYVPGVKNRFSPCASALLIVVALSPGCAT